MTTTSSEEGAVQESAIARIFLPYRLLRESVTVEYELTRHMALQLLEGDPKASGFDFVFKFDW